MSLLSERIREGAEVVLAKYVLAHTRDHRRLRDKLDMVENMASRDVNSRAMEERVSELERRCTTLATLLRSSNTKREELAAGLVEEAEVEWAHAQDHEERISELENRRRHDRRRDRRRDYDTRYDDKGE
jgi:acetoin utilization deacetylase AcuC-like enzyme